jgi:hypothetical protein
MAGKSYKIPKSVPMNVDEPAVAYRTVTSETLSSDKWNPNVPFHGTQEEWWEHFHRIEEGNFVTWEEHQKKFYAWKKNYLASLM